MKTKVALVEDNEKTCAYLAALLGGDDGLELVLVSGRGNEALEKLAETQPDVMIVDINLPDISGVELTRAVKERHPRVEVLILTIHESREYLFSALQAGASGYLVKGTSSADILSAISLLMAGGAPMSPAMARYVIEEFQDVKVSRDAMTLTKREREVLRGIAAGLSERKLAVDLGVSPHTVHTHIKKIYRKLQVNSRAEAVLKARNKGIV